MIITCDVCSKRYLIDPVSLGSTGRVVRCSSCGHAWHQNPPDDMPKTLVENSEKEADAFNKKEDIRLSATFAQDIPDVSRGFSGSVCEPLRPSHPVLTNSWRASKKYGGFLLGFFLIGFIAFLYFGRFYVVHHWPSLISIYSSLGMKTNSLARHLELQNVTWTTSMDEKQTPVFVLKGHVFNSSQKALAIPPLSVVFVSGSYQGKNCPATGCIIDRWIAYTSSERILPGESYPFQIVIHKKIPKQATNLYVEFVRP